MDILPPPDGAPSWRENHLTHDGLDGPCHDLAVSTSSFRTQVFAPLASTLAPPGVSDDGPPAISGVLQQQQTCSALKGQPSSICEQAKLERNAQADQLQAELRRVAAEEDRAAEARKAKKLAKAARMVAGAAAKPRSQ